MLKLPGSGTRKIPANHLLRNSRAGATPVARRRGDGSRQAMLRVNPEVARALRGPERDVLNEIEDYLGAVDVTSDPRVHQEQFDFAFA